MSQSGIEDVEARIARLEQQDQRLTRALELLARHEEAPAAKPRRNWNAYAAVIASLIGILALAVSGYTAHLQRQQLRAQMWPHLQIRYSGVSLLFKVLNQGTGPARVTGVRVTVNGAPVKDWSDVRKAAGVDGEDRFTSSSISTAVLSPGADFVILQTGDTEQSRARFKTLFPGNEHELSLTVCYCSVLDECWVAYLGRGRRDDGNTSDGGCPITAGERFDD